MKSGIKAVSTFTSGVEINWDNLNFVSGSNSLLRKYKIVVGGYQLTRVCLEEAKQLRSLSTTPKKRFDNVHPFVIELWHTKQDFLEVSKSQVDERSLIM